MNIEKIWGFETSDSERDNFFLNVFPTIDSFTKAKILKHLMKKIKFFNSYISRSNAKSKILEELKKEINIFIEEKNIQKGVLLLPIILFYTNMNINDIESDILLKPLKQLLFMTKNEDLVDNQDFNEIVINITKIVAYAFSYEEEYNLLKNNKNYEYYEEIIYSYIDKIKESKMIDNELINLLIETFPAIAYPKLKDRLSSKYKEEIDLKKYNLNKKISIEKDFVSFLEDIKKYRIKYGIIPEEICICANKFYNNNKDIMRLCNIDLIRHYLIKNGIKDICVFYDREIEVGAKGFANKKTLSIKDINLSSIMFHEARHVIQFNNIENDKNYNGYNYNILKDYILYNNMDISVYNRNHQRYYFEIDADIEGQKEYYKILEKINLVSEAEKEKMAKLDETEQFKIAMASHLNVDGYNYEKGILFDDIIQKNNNLLNQYPVLQIEYDNLGKRKTMLDILKSMEDELNQNRRTKEEIMKISNCIFGEFYEVKDIDETLNSLINYHFQNSVILEIEKNLISELQTLINNDRNLDVENNFEENRKK